MLLADSTLTESPEELETLPEETPIIFMSLDDDEENIGFDDLEDLDDDGFDDDDDDFDDDDEDDDDLFGDEEDEDDFEDDDFDDDDDF